MIFPPTPVISLKGVWTCSWQEDSLFSCGRSSWSGCPDSLEELVNFAEKAFSSQALHRPHLAGVSPQDRPGLVFPKYHGIFFVNKCL